jgi:Domain of unknown function (DUF1816)
MKIQEIWLSLLHFIGLAWWVEIGTDRPNCTYYFGPFASATEAKNLIAGYVEDLESEAAEGIHVALKRCKPTQITIEREEPLSISEYSPPHGTSSLRGQFS